MAEELVLSALMASTEEDTVQIVSETLQVNFNRSVFFFFNLVMIS